MNIPGELKLMINGVEAGTVTDFSFERMTRAKETVTRRVLGGSMAKLTSAVGSFNSAIVAAGMAARRAREDLDRFAGMWAMPPLRHVRCGAAREMWRRRIARDGRHRRHRRAERRLNKAARRAARKA